MQSRARIRSVTSGNGKAESMDARAAGEFSVNVRVNFIAALRRRFESG